MIIIIIIGRVFVIIRKLYLMEPSYIHLKKRFIKKIRGLISRFVGEFSLIGIQMVKNILLLISSERKFT